MLDEDSGRKNVVACALTVVLEQDRAKAVANATGLIECKQAGSVAPDRNKVRIQSNNEDYRFPVAPSAAGHIVGSVKR